MNNKIQIIKYNQLKTILQVKINFLSKTQKSNSLTIKTSKIINSLVKNQNPATKNHPHQRTIFPILDKYNKTK